MFALHRNDKKGLGGDTSNYRLKICHALQTRLWKASQVGQFSQMSTEECFYLV